MVQAGPAPSLHFLPVVLLALSDVVVQHNACEAGRLDHVGCHVPAVSCDGSAVAVVPVGVQGVFGCTAW